MRLFGKRTARQKEIRRSKAERGHTWYHRLREQLELPPLLFLVVCALLTGLIVNVGEDPPDSQVGQRVARGITARVSFRLADEARTQVERMRARDNAEDYYLLDVSLLQDVRGRLTNALRIAREHAADPGKLREQAAEISILFDDAGLEEITRLATADDQTVFPQAVERGLVALRQQPLVEPGELAHRRTGMKSVLVDPERGTKRPALTDRLLYSNNREHILTVLGAAAAEFPPSLRDTVRSSLLQMFQGESEGLFKPLYVHDAVRSAAAAKAAEDSVPPQYIPIAAGDRLADAGLITAEEIKLLRAEQTQFVAQREADPQLHDLHRLVLLARGLLAFLLVIGVGGYILVHHEATLGGHQRRFATALTLLLMLLLARAAYLTTPYVYLAAGAQGLAITLLAITSGRGPAYAAGGMLALLIAAVTGQGVLVVALLVATSLVQFLGLRDVRNRGRIIAVGALAALVAGLGAQVIGFVENQDVSFVFWNRALWAALATLAGAFIVEGILPGIERLFGVTTNMTLLEWCDPNKPLLRMLAADSPGTYNHSLLVGTLADAAAEAIDANGLLARAGAYYHDIGKVNKPEYFVENQAAGMGNVHDRLSPAMSHLIIIGHVKDGVAMAKEYNLPASLHAFIPEHHGTCVVEYFYHAANRARKPGDSEIDDEQFRYPGPKPQSRETAIVMLCDGVEGAVRSMPEPTPNRIEDTVAKITQKRMMDGQFDECDLTFRELEIIRNSLVKTLCAIYHGRITYPTSEPEHDETRQAS